MGFWKAYKERFVFKNKEKKVLVKPSETNHGFLQVTCLSLNLNDKRQLNRINQSVQQIRLQFLEHFHTNLNGA